MNEGSQGMENEHYSELLRPYALDELDDHERGEVDSHLASCERCRVELRSIQVLQRDEAPRLEPREQRDLHAAVASALETREPAIIGARSSAEHRFARRFAPTLGAAALLLLVAVVGFSGLGGGGDDSGAEGGPAPAAESAGGAGGGGDKARKEPPFEAEDQEPTGGPEETTDSLESLAGAGEPKPEFLAQRFTSVADRPLLRRFTRYTSEDAAEREGLYLSLMAQEAPGDVRDQVIDCGERVREETEEPVLAAYGAFTTVDDERGLLLSFVFSESSAGRLTDYMVWAWPLGNCSTRLEYHTGELED